MSIIALDLFAGSGWGVACQRLGIEEYGVELMPEARETRRLNGMHTLYEDVWEGLLAELDTFGRPYQPDYDLLIASPPCQTFSMAGGGAGRRALDDVLAAIDDRLYLHPEKLRAFGDKHDPRTALVLTPLAHVARDTPTYVVLEQVPPVLPVWERYATEMRQWGYSVWTGILNAEQYGAPQTRRRAILIARADGIEAAPPTPTHSRYYSRDPKRLDPGVLPWVSMAEALGWGRTARPSVTVAGGGTETGGAEPLAKIAREVAAPDWRMRSSQSVAGGPRAERSVLDPALTVTTNTDRAQWTQHRPASTVVGTRRSEGGMLIGRQLGDDSRRDNGGKPGSVGLKRSDLPGVRVTVEEAAALQSYPPGFMFAGTKTKQFLQVGNAVPPLLAEAILRTVL